MAAVTRMAAPALPCNHRVETGCVLTALPSCCACADRRPMATAYPVYIDGEGMKNTGRRWQMYCWKCRDYYNHQVEATSISSNLSQQNSSSLEHANMVYRIPHRRGAQIPQGHRAATVTISPTLQHRVNSRLSALNITDQVLPADSHANPDPRPSRYEEQPAQAQRHEPVYPLGTREEVQEDDYQSPIANMFVRAWGRFRVAEEVRQAERAMNPEAAEFNYNPARGRSSPLGRQTTPSVVMPQPSTAESQAQHARDGISSVLMNATTNAAQQYPTAFFQAHPGSSAEGTELIRQLIAANRDTPTMYTNPFLRPPEEDTEQYDEDRQYEDEYDQPQPSAIDLQIQRPEPLSEEQKTANIACKICGEQKIDTLTEPCMHIATCRWCAAIWEEGFRQERMNNPTAKHRCVLCRRTIKNTRRVYLP